MARALSVRHKGSFKKLTDYLNSASKFDGTRMSVLEEYANRGVLALQQATPKDTGLTASSWKYEIERDSGGLIQIHFINTNVKKHVNIAIILDTGHGTGGGGWVEGRHYIAPAIQPIFDELAEKAWQEVSKQ